MNCIVGSVSVTASKAGSRAEELVPCRLIRASFVFQSNLLNSTNLDAGTKTTIRQQPIGLRIKWRCVSRCYKSLGGDGDRTSESCGDRHAPPRAVHLRVERSIGLYYISTDVCAPTPSNNDCTMGSPYCGQSNRQSRELRP